jgi:ABC-type Fe3+-hydroxamate transport system substrate-binding protein
MHNMKRVVGLLLVLALPLAACGGDDDSAATPPTTEASAEPTVTASPGPSTTGADQSATTAAGNETTSSGNATVAADGSITIEHQYGTTTLERQPERIVSLDLQWTDVLVALDAPLAGAARDPLMAEADGLYPWQVDAIPDDVTAIEVDPSGAILPYEAVAALAPDLIVVTWAATERADYDRLSEIAPTIPLLGDRDVDLWQDLAKVGGALIGDPAKADALIADAEARTATLAAELPGLAGKTYAMANYVPGGAITVVADPDDGAAKVFTELGLEIDPDLLAIADGATGRVDISLERIDELDADLLIMLTNGADTDEIAGYSALPAVQHGAVAIMSLADVVGLNTPTPLSVPYALDVIRPALEAAAA